MWFIARFCFCLSFYIILIKTTISICTTNCMSVVSPGNYLIIKLTSAVWPEIYYNMGWITTTMRLIGDILTYLITNVTRWWFKHPGVYALLLCHWGRNKWLRKPYRMIDPQLPTFQTLESSLCILMVIWLNCLLRWQHPQHSLLWDIWDQDGPHESVRPAALVLLPVAPRRHPGEPHQRETMHVWLCKHS